MSYKSPSPCVKSCTNSHKNRITNFSLTINKFLLLIEVLSVFLVVKPTDMSDEGEGRTFQFCFRTNSETMLLRRCEDKASTHYLI